jgi:hypothetical protein
MRTEDRAEDPSSRIPASDFDVVRFGSGRRPAV